MDDSELRRTLADLRSQLSTLRVQVGELRQLERRHRELSEAVDDVRRELSDRADELQQLERQHRELSEAVDDVRRELGDRADELEHDVDNRVRALRGELERALAPLGRRLRWIERHVRATAGAVIAQLDPTPDLILLAQQADRGKTRSAQLLEPDSRAVKDNAIKTWETWQTEHRAHTTAALNASHIIANTAPDAPTRFSARTAYQAARTVLADLDARRDSTRQAAETAAQQLARDDALRCTLTSDITEGEQAWVSLNTRLRTQLADSVTAGKLLPVWFDTVLGMTPPADANPWLQAGTELLAYRATYAINDPVVALGPAPDAGFSTRRREWHQRLTSLLRDYH